jgi:hypothetical protein
MVAPKAWDNINWWVVWRVYDRPSYRDLSIYDPKTWDSWSRRIYKRDYYDDYIDRTKMLSRWTGFIIATWIPIGAIILVWLIFFIYLSL